jgi:hypothetical protein
MRVPFIGLFKAIGVILIAITPSARAQYVYNRADFPIATGPGIDVAVADFNGDGILDLAVVMGGVENSQGTLSILLGKPDGTFGPHTDYPLGIYSSNVLVGDFNGDGKPDIAVLNRNLGGGPSGPAYVSILLGNGDGTFQPQITTSFGANASGMFYMVAGDFNGDGKLDLMAALTNGQIEVLLGNGDGTFGAPIATPVTTDAFAYQLWWLAAGDFNRDGKLDVAVPLDDISTGTRSVAVLLGNGDGTFQAPVTYSMQGNNDIVAADVNHDGILDLIGDGPQVSVLLGNGDGTFQPEIDTGVVISFLVLGDFNGDGNLDAAGVASYGASGGRELKVILGDGKGNFHSLFTTPLPYNSGILRLGDFNGDGVLDLALPGPSRVSILLGNGDGTMGPSILLPDVNGPQSAAVADFNGDGKPDLAIGESYEGSQTVDIRLGNGDGTFTVGSPVTLNGTPMVVLSADFNHDGKADLAALLGSPCTCIQIFLGNGDGTFTTGSKLPAIFDDDALVAADFNGDGNLDLLVGGLSSPARLFLGNGDGTFQSPVGRINWVTGQTGQLIAADFNHDGKTDVAGTTNNLDTLEIFLGNGDGTFQPAVSYPTDFNPEGLVAADFNGDGKLDIAIATGEGINLLLGKGDGTFQPYTKVQYSETSGYFTDWIVAGDFNGDGKTDLAAGFRQNGIVYVLLGNGDGTFSAPLDFSVPAQLMTMATGDFNRDGVTDLALGSGPVNPGNASAFSVWTSAPLASIRPRALDFGGVPVGSSSAPQTVNLWNVGTAPLELEGVTAGGDFSQTSDCGNRVAAGSQCSIQVTFAPAGGGTRNSTLVLTDNATIHELTVPLLGTGTGLSVIASPWSVAFGSVLVGATTSSQTVTLSNTGSVSLSLSAVAVAGPFAIVTSGTTCAASGTVGPGSSCTVAVDFTPTAGGQATGTLSFSDNAAGSPQTVALTGTGLDFSLAAASGSSTTATVTAGQTATYNLGLTETPGFNATIIFTCTGAPPLATCTVSPSIVAPSGPSTTAITVTIATTAGSITLPELRLVPPRDGYPAYPWSAIGLLMSAALALGLAARTRRAAPTSGAASTRMSFSIAAIAAILMALALMVPACGGGGGGTTIHNPGTPPGTYSVTLTGTATSGSTTLTNKLELTLTVN